MEPFVAASTLADIVFKTLPSFTPITKASAFVFTRFLGNSIKSILLLIICFEVFKIVGSYFKLKCLPSDYARQGRVLCNIEASEGESMTKAVMDLLGENCLVYGSDFPHPECDWPKSVDNVLGWKSISETAMKKLLGDNADTYLR